MTINAKITAYNTFGESAVSAIGGGAVIQLVPDQPIIIENIISITLDDRIRIVWQDGISTGLTSIKYKVWYDWGLSAYKILTSVVTTGTYTAAGLYSAISF